jgi:hypothetical protein
MNIELDFNLGLRRSKSYINKLLIIILALINILKKKFTKYLVNNLLTVV